MAIIFLLQRKQTLLSRLCYQYWMLKLVPLTSEMIVEGFAASDERQLTLSLTSSGIELMC